MKTIDYKLKPCPFCGGEPKIFRNRSYFGIRCCISLIGFTGNNRIKKAVEKWNKRAK